MHKSLQNIILSQEVCDAHKNISVRKTYINRVYGTIFNTRGKTINDVTIKIVDQELNPIMHTITSNDGTFTLLSNQCNSYQLIISKPGFVTLLIKTITFNYPMCFTLEKMQINSCDVIGQCFYSDGTHAESVIVLLDKETVNIGVITDEHGYFSFHDIDYGLHKLEISGQTCEQYKAYFELCDSNQLLYLSSIYLKKKNIGCTIHGIIKDSYGVVLSCVLVLLYCSLCKKLVMKTYTNKDGVYFFGNLEKGSYYVEAIY